MRYVYVKLTLRELRGLISEYERYASNCERFATVSPLKFQASHLDRAGKHQTRANELSGFLPKKKEAA